MCLSLCALANGFVQCKMGCFALLNGTYCRAKQAILPGKTAAVGLKNVVGEVLWWLFRPSIPQKQLLYLLNSALQNTLCRIAVYAEKLFRPVLMVLFL